jgi:hypothetical protein
VSDAFGTAPFSPERRQQMDWFALGRAAHSMHALLDADITDARRSIREYRARTREPLSVVAFIAWCLGKTVDEDRLLHAYRWRRRLVVFDDVDATMFVAADIAGTQVPIPHIVRGLNRRTPAEIEAELQMARRSPPRAAGRLLALWMLVPAGLRRLVWRAVLANPLRRKRMTGTVAITSVGSYARGTAWGIPITTYTTCLTIGGFGRRPGIVGRGLDERIEPRDYVTLTITFNHDIVDGAPAMAFCARLRNRIERGLAAD